ncbi:MAG: hypothetical protein WDM92_15465 [Caulobacteraceae bacterium]
MQRLFITTPEDDNIRAVAIDGVFDDCQAIVKSLFQDEDLHNAGLSGVNSINWARIAAQTVYYVYSAVALGAPHRPVALLRAHPATSATPSPAMWPSRWACRSSG